jgi:hypothetical protein
VGPCVPAEDPLAALARGRPAIPPVRTLPSHISCARQPDLRFLVVRVGAEVDLVWWRRVRRARAPVRGGRRPAQGGDLADRFGSVERRGGRAEPAPRRRQLLPLGALPGRDRPPRHRSLTGLRRRAREQRRG